MSQVWEERLGSCERAVNQAFVAMVCLHVSASPSSARGPGAGDHPHSNSRCGAKGPVVRDPRPGCLSHTGFSQRCCGYLSVAGARVQSLPLFPFLVALGCLFVVDNQLSHHQQDRRSVEEAKPSCTLVHLPPYRSNRLTQPVDHVSIPQTCLAFVSWSSFLYLLCCFFDRSSWSMRATGRQRSQRQLDPTRDIAGCQRQRHRERVLAMARSETRVSGAG